MGVGANRRLRESRLYGAFRHPKLPNITGSNAGTYNVRLAIVAELRKEFHSKWHSGGQNSQIRKT
jgi:hypothetical protein